MAKKFDLLRYQSLFIPLSIFLGGLAVAAAIIYTGGLGRMSSTANDLLPTSDAGGEVQVSVDDDPGLGDPNAPVTIVEFLSFECPFCQSFHKDTLPQIKSQYIDTGKVRFVVRDLPLSFQDPAATKDALAADCARDQRGDEVYFLYHDEIFARTGTEGAGLPKEGKTDGYEAAAKKIGLDVPRFKSCLSSGQFKDEVAKDLADAQTYGANGTPTFFVGKTDSSGTFTGQVISGAQPFESFQLAIDALLAE